MSKLEQKLATTFTNDSADVNEIIEYYKLIRKIWNTDRDRSRFAFNNTDRKNAVKMLPIIIDNIDSFAKVKESPNTAMKGVITIIKSLDEIFYLSEMKAMVIIGFISDILEFVGRTRRGLTNPLSVVIEEEIDKVSKFHSNKDFVRKARDIMKSLALSKKFLRRLLKYKPANKLIPQLPNQISAVKNNKKMAELVKVVKKVFDKNDASTAPIDLQMFEVFAKIVTYYELILMQGIDMLSLRNKLKLPMMAKRTEFRKMIKAPFERLYIKANQTWKYGSKFIPYFDHDVHTITDFYARNILKLASFDQKVADKLHCLRFSSGKDLVWSKYEKHFVVTDKPYITIANKSLANCYWKLVPHGQNSYSIVNKDQCQKHHEYCGAMLSYATRNGKRYVTIDNDHPTLWQINWKGDNKSVR